MQSNQGHRQRVKARFLAEGLDNFDEVHALELLLFYAVPQRDTKALARELLNYFTTINAVLDAPVEELRKVPGVGEHVAVYLSMMGQLERYRRLRRDCKIKVMDSPATYGNYLASCLAGRRNEMVYLLCLDAKYKLISCRQVGEGDVNSANIPVRRMVEIGLSANASMVILAHNHPGGVATPSREDVMTTLAFAQALRPLGILLLDHVIVADDDFITMRQSGIYTPEAL